VGHAAYDLGTHRRALACGILLGVAAASGCAVNAVTGDPELTISSSERQRALGTKAAKSIEALMGMVDDRALSDYVSTIGERLVRALPGKDVNYTFKVLDSDVPNAMSLPGGYVYITRGLLAYLNSEDELACVLGHEIGHVAAHHSSHQRTRGILASPFAIATGIAGAATSIVAPAVGDLIAGVGKITTGAVLASYSREQEREADRLGMTLAAKSGWSPTGMTGMLETLSRSEKLATGRIRKTGFLDSHPSTPERAAAATKRAQELRIAESTGSKLDRLGFYHRLEGLIIGDNPKNGIFVENRFLHAALDLSVEFPDSWILQNSRDAVAAIEKSQQAALVMQGLGEGDDPLVAASTRRMVLGFSLQDVKRSTINGLPAAHVTTVVAGTRGRTALSATWIVHHDLIYEIVGLCSPEQYPQFEQALNGSADSFAPLSSSDRARIKADQLTVAAARRDETLHDVLDRIDATWSPAEAAVANALADGGQLPEGRAIKAPVSRAYTAK
jgi:predicted Zn-dependent protease